MADVLLGLIARGLGLGVCFFGLQAFFIMLPIWGVLGGFVLGASVVANWLGTGFLADVTGFLVGLVFAVLAYFYWYFGALFAAGSVGALLGVAVMRALGLEAYCGSSRWWLAPSSSSARWC